MGMEVTLILALLLGLYMAFSIGANDVANAIGTSVGSKALTIKQIFSAIYADLDLEREPMSGGRQMVGHFVTKNVIDNIMIGKCVWDVKLNLVWEPPWDTDKMSEAANLELNLWATQ